jgi:hypothetical protein
MFILLHVPLQVRTTVYSTPSSYYCMFHSKFVLLYVPLQVCTTVCSTLSSYYCIFHSKFALLYVPLQVVLLYVPLQVRTTVCSTSQVRDGRPVRRDPSMDDTTSYDYAQQAVVLEEEVLHDGGDVAIYATGTTHSS